MSNDKYEYDNQMKYKRKKIQKLELESMKYTCQQELFEHDKEVVFTMNNIVNSYNFIDNHMYALDKDISASLTELNKDSTKKKLKIAFNNDFTLPPNELKDKKLIKRYNIDQALKVDKTSLIINNLSSITVFENSECLKGKFYFNQSASL